MAKAEKPESGNKTASQTSKGPAEKPKATSTSAQSRASAKKPAAGSATSQTKPKTTKKAPAKETSASADAKVTSKPAEKTKTSGADTQSDQLAKSKPAEPEKPVEPAVNTAPDKPAGQPEAKPASPVTATPAQKNRPFWPLVLGGLVAGGIGFAVSQADLFGTRGDTDDLRAAIARNQAEIETLKSAEPVDLSGVEGIRSDLAALTDDISGLKETAAQLTTRIATLEARPVVDGADPDAAAAYAAELAGLKSSVEAQRSEIEALLSNARTVEEATADAARIAAGQGALARISTAMNSGSSYASEIDALNAAGIEEVPPALAASAADGVATLANLQSRFPDVARAVLADARAAGGEAAEPGLSGFLKRQLGARSVTPREGSDPDAVLSRADAAVRDGKIEDALQEMQALPQETLEAAQDWIADARARVAAQAAVQTLSQRLTAN